MDQAAMVYLMVMATILRAHQWSQDVLNLGIIRHVIHSEPKETQDGERNDAKNFKSYNIMQEEDMVRPVGDSRAKGGIWILA